MRNLIILILILGALVPRPCHALFGEELAPLFQLVAGQVKEIETLANQVGATQEQSKFLSDLNAGIDQTVRQIQAIQDLVERAQGLSPSAVRSIAELNDYLHRVNDAKRAVDEILSIRVEAAGLAVEQSSVQSETAYLMGQEMIATGGDLARESQTPLCQERCRTEIVKYTGAKGHQKWVPHIILKNLNSQQSGSFYREEIGRCV